jgi:hypothetical protein
MVRLFLSVVVALALGVASSVAQHSAFQLSLTPRVALEPETTTINGVSLGAWSQNPQHSLTVGFVNGSTEDSGGFSWAVLANYNTDYTGVALSLVNVSHNSFTGWQSGVFNYSEGAFAGLQSGWVNYSEKLHGLQMGLINYTEKLHGVQVGLLNIARNNPVFKEFPNKLATGTTFVNWSF